VLFLLAISSPQRREVVRAVGPPPPPESAEALPTIPRKQNRRLCTVPGPASRGSFASPPQCDTRPQSPADSGNVSPVPFHARGAPWRPRAPLLTASFQPPFGYRLGPSDPTRNALLSEPFLASVFGVLAQIIATPTKICTSGCSTRRHRQASPQPPRPPTPRRLWCATRPRYKPPT